MAYIDKTDAKELVEKHGNSFRKFSSRKDLEIFIHKIVSKSYYFLLFLQSLLLGGIWYFLLEVNPNYGSFFLLAVILVQAKLLLDNNFDSVEDNILDAIDEAGICDDEGKNDEIPEKDSRNDDSDKEDGEIIKN